MHQSFDQKCVVYFIRTNKILWNITNINSASAVHAIFHFNGLGLRIWSLSPLQWSLPRPGTIYWWPHELHMIVHKLRRAGRNEALSARKMNSRKKVQFIMREHRHTQQMNCVTAGCRLLSPIYWNCEKSFFFIAGQSSHSINCTRMHTKNMDCVI